MAASTWFIMLSLISIVVPLGWALYQLRTQPTKSIQVIVPVAIAIFSFAAFTSGRLANSQQQKEIERLKPRSVTDRQRAQLKQRLPKAIPPIRIIYRMMDSEGQDYSNSLAGAIKDAGGTVLSIVGGSLADLRGKVTVVILSGDKKTEASADHLCNLFTDIAIECGGDIGPGQLTGTPTTGEILLVVGRKD